MTTVVAVQTCAECSGKAAASPVTGTVDASGGVQVIEVGLESGYYVPNSFDVRSGIPVRVTFTGKAVGCLARPVFKSLGRRADISAADFASIDLGALKPGTYAWTCGMGSPGGVITVH